MKNYITLQQLKIYFLEIGLAILGEIGIWFLYIDHDARFHWFTHFFIGGATALLIMSVIAWRTRKPVRMPLVWILVGHLYAMFPDFLFTIFMIVHRMWMDVFLLHITAHFIPGRNTTWYVIFMISLGIYLFVLNKRTK
jgi:hypothetical protein